MWLRDTFLAAPCANSLISITLLPFTHTTVTSHTIIHPNPKPNQKNLKFGPRILNPNIKVSKSHKERLPAALVLGWGILDSALYLTQYSIIKELAQGAARRCSLCVHSNLLRLKGARNYLKKIVQTYFWTIKTLSVYTLKPRPLLPLRVMVKLHKYFKNQRGYFFLHNGLRQPYQNEALPEFDGLVTPL